MRTRQLSSPSNLSTPQLTFGAGKEPFDFSPTNSAFFYDADNPLLLSFESVARAAAGNHEVMAPLDLGKLLLNRTNIFHLTKLTHTF
jgi:hypothetical protein